jgi:hypothetical protein
MGRKDEKKGMKERKPKGVNRSGLSVTKINKKSRSRLDPERHHFFFFFFDFDLIRTNMNKKKRNSSNVHHYRVETRFMGNNQLHP